MSSRRGRSSVGLLLALGGGGLVVIVLIVVLTLSGGSSANAPASYQQYTTAIDTSYATGAPGFAIGQPNAPVTVVDYSDFSCAACSRLSPAIETVIEEYVAEGQVRVIYKPLTFVAPASLEAGRAAYCAAEQGYFWEMHDQLWDIFAASGTTGYTLRNITTYAEPIEGLNVDTWRTCYNAPATTQALQSVVQEAQQLGVESVPTVFINAERVNFQADFEQELIAAIEAILN